MKYFGSENIFRTLLTQHSPRYFTGPAIEQPKFLVWGIQSHDNKPGS